MKIKRSKLKKMIESYISVPGKGLAPLHRSEVRIPMDEEALEIAKDILKKAGLEEPASRLDNPSESVETIRQIYDAVKALDTEGRLTPVHDQAVEIMFNAHDNSKGRKFGLDQGVKLTHKNDFSQFNNTFGKYDAKGVIDINTGRTVPSISLSVSYKTYDHMSPDWRDTVEEVVSSIKIPAYIITSAYGQYLLWSKKADSSLGDIYNEHASRFLLLADKLDYYLEEYTNAFVKNSNPNQNITVFQIAPVNIKLKDVIRRSADIDNLP